MASDFWSSCPSHLSACIPGTTITLDSKKPVTQAGDLGFMLTFPSLPFTDSEPWREMLFVTMLWWSRINSPAFQRGQEDWLCRTDLEDVGPQWASGLPCCRYAKLLFKACPACHVALSLACYLLVSKVPLTFACLAKDLRQLRLGVTCSTSLLQETTAGTDRYLLDSLRPQAFLCVGSAARAVFSVSGPHLAVRPWTPTGLALRGGGYKRALCWFGLRLKQTILETLEASVEGTLKGP